MSIQRETNPLPVGRYWITISGQSLINEWGDWVRDMGKGLQVETTEEGDGTLFTIFRVKNNAVFLNSEQFGFPNKAPSSVKNQDDVEQKPEVEEVTTESVLKGAITVGKLAAFSIVGAIIYSIVKKRD